MVIARNNCRGGPLWPPLCGVKEGVATEGHPYNRFFDLFFVFGGEFVVMVPVTETVTPTTNRTRSRFFRIIHAMLHRRYSSQVREDRLQILVGHVLEVAHGMIEFNFRAPTWPVRNVFTNIASS